MDLRLPIGGLFSIYGLILSGYGLFGPKQIYAQSLGMNVNLLWGAVMLVFGLAFVYFGWRASAGGVAAGLSDKKGDRS